LALGDDPVQAAEGIEEHIKKNGLHWGSRGVSKRFATMAAGIF